jgi:hypothetical protein
VFPQHEAPPPQEQGSSQQALASAFLASAPHEQSSHAHEPHVQASVGQQPDAHAPSHVHAPPLPQEQDSQRHSPPQHGPAAQHEPAGAPDKPSIIETSIATIAVLLGGQTAG